MDFFKKMLPRVNLIEMLLGVSLGTGYMTSLRFLGPIGVSEVLMFFFLFLMLGSNFKEFLAFPKNEYGKIKLFLFITIVFVFPLVTGFYYFFGDVGSNPIYIISFIAGCFLSFVIAENIDKNIDMNSATLWFALTFILTNFVWSQVNPEALLANRYTGAAKNPNQLVFYATSLTLLLIIYNRLAALVYIPFILYFMLRVGSDAYILSLVVTVVLSVFLYVLFKNKFNSSIRIFLLLLLSFLALIFALSFYSQELLVLWLDADEGNARTTLMKGGLIASLKSPLFGYGAGSFVTTDFMTNAEAHNTFLDLSMQFGFLLPMVVYYIFGRYFFYKFNNRKALDCAFFAAFIISGLFHFSGRHFVFWVELGVFMSFVYFKNDSNKLAKPVFR